MRKELTEAQKGIIQQYHNMRAREGDLSLEIINECDDNFINLSHLGYDSLNDLVTLMHVFINIDEEDPDGNELIGVYCLSADEFIRAVEMLIACRNINKKYEK